MQQTESVKISATRFPSSEGLFDVEGPEPDAFERLRKAESIGRPVGDEAFLDRVSAALGKTVSRAKPGRKAREGI